MLYPLTKTKQFRFILYPTPERFDALKGFYANYLGFPIIAEWDHPPRGMTLNAGSAVIEILISRAVAPAKPEGASLSLDVDDVWALWEKIKDNREVINYELRDNSWGDTAFGILDPEGLQISFFSPTKKKV